MGLRFSSAALVVSLAALLSACEDAYTPIDAGVQMMVPPPRMPDCLRLPETLDFGEVERGQRAELNFVLNNNTLKPLVIEMGRLDDPFFAGIEGAQQIESGRPFTLRFSFAPPDGRLHVTSVTFRGGAGCQPQLLSLSGRGAGEVVAPSFFDLGPVPVGTRFAKTLTVTNSRRAPVALTLTLNTNNFTAPASITIPALGAAEIEISITAPTTGSFNDTLIIVSDLGDRLFVGLAASGGIPDLRADRSSLRIDRLPMSNDPNTFPLVQRSVSLSNQGEGPVRISSVTVRANGGSAVDEVRVVLFNNFLSPTAATSLLVQLQPRRIPGPRSWALQIASDQPNLPVLEIPITAEVVTLPDCLGSIFASPVALTVPANTLPVMGSITIHNPGAQDCLLDDIRFTPAEWQLVPQVEQLLVPAQGEATLAIDLNHAGVSTLIFNPVGADVGYATVQVRAQ